MKKIILWFLNSPVTGPSSILALRLMAGSLIFGEGILQLWCMRQGAGALTKMDFDLPDTTTYITATLEIVSGLFLILGLFTRITVLYIILQVLRILSLKIDSYFAIRFLQLPPDSTSAIWVALYDLRSYYAQLLVCLFLLLEGAGRRSIDFKIHISKKVYSMGDN